MKQILMCAMLLLFLCGDLAAVENSANPLHDAQRNAAAKALPENKQRVINAMQAAALAASETVHYSVPAMSDVMRLPYAFPEDGRLNGELRIVAAQGEFEPASFLLYSFKDRKNVTLHASELKSAEGETIPANQLDLKVVKVWFQNGNGWNSYFSDVGLKLIPELLLYDENMIKVDAQEMANYARLKDENGERYAWISAPRHLDVPFNSTQEPFEDADVLQPVSLIAGEFKQFFLTLHVPKTQKPGVYNGSVAVTEGSGALTNISIAVRVLPFELPLPRPYFDLKRDFIVSIMGGTTLSGMANLFGGDEKLALEKYRAYLANQRDHGIFHPCVDQNDENFKLLKELGLPTKPMMMGKNFLPWFGKNFGGRLSFDNYMSAKDAARECAEYYTKLLGHTDVLSNYGDEQGTAFVATHRNFFKYFHDYGIKMGCAGHDALLNKGGYTYAIHPMGGEPDAVGRIKPWNEIGDKYVGFYASQHTGSENPQFVRRQHGLLGYLNNLSMVFNYEFALGPWNDLSLELYKPMVLAYLNRGGLVDTLQWEGFREGIDDMRYATKLKLVAQEAIESGNTERMLEGRKALQFMALLDASAMDLNAVRAEMINYILKLSNKR